MREREREREREKDIEDRKEEEKDKTTKVQLGARRKAPVVGFEGLYCAGQAAPPRREREREKDNTAGAATARQWEYWGTITKNKKLTQEPC